MNTHSLTCAADGTLLEVSDDLAAALGYPSGPDVMHQVGALGELAADRSSRTLVARGMWERLDQRDARWLHRSGLPTWFRTHLVDRSEDGTHVLRFADASGSRKVRAELRLARESNRLGPMAGGVLHDVYDIFGAILLVSESMERSGLSVPDVELAPELRHLRVAALRGAHMIRHLMVFSEVEPMKRRSVSLASTVGSAMPLMQRLLRSDEPLMLDVLQAAQVMADPSALEHVLLTLVSSPPGLAEHRPPVRLEVGLAEMDAATCEARGWGTPGRYGSVTVHGIGTAWESILPRGAFDPTLADHGTGGAWRLGAAMVYGMMKQQRGYLETLAAAEPGDGGAVRLLVPLDRGGEPTAPNSLAPGNAVPGPSRAKRPVDILVVEDDPDLGAALARVLEREGYRVELVGDATEGLALLHSGPPAPRLVIADVAGPAGGGAALSRALAASHPAVPMVLSGTAGQAPPTPRAARRSFLPRPLSLDGLLHAVQEILANPDNL